MCGICGFSGIYSKELLLEMNNKIAHRGPDGNGFEFLAEDEVGLGHRRLAIIDLSPTGAQPMWDESKTACITFNGEIYNFREF